MTTIETISDTHSNRHQYLSLKGANILIHAGDFSNYGEKKELAKFFKWLNSLDNYDYKIFIAGNHDVSLEEKPDWVLEEMDKLDSKTTYLENNGITINGLNIYGSPNCPKFGNWAFMKNSEELYSIYSKIPNDTDILITHSPPLGILDVNREGIACGATELLEHNKNVLLHVFGHIHESYGVIQKDNSCYCNTSIYKVPYETRNINSSILFEIEDRKIINYTN